MSENTKIWDLLGRTDPKHTQQFKRGGGFKGTAIKPIWSFRRMTEEFGPCGIGWGVGQPSFQVVPGVNQETLVYCTVAVWYRHGDEPSQQVYGVGGDKIVSHVRANEQYNRPERWENDDEAFKKAFTDAITNALKLIGVGADVHMGRFEDSKYVNEMRDEFAEDEPPANDQKRTSSAALKREAVWPEMEREIAECATVPMLLKLRGEWSRKALRDRWPNAWLDAAAETFDKAEAALRQPVDDDASVKTNEYAKAFRAG